MMLCLTSPSGVKTELEAQDLQWYVQRFGPLPNGWTVERTNDNDDD